MSNTKLTDDVISMHYKISTSVFGIKNPLKHATSARFTADHHQCFHSKEHRDQNTKHVRL